MPSLGKGVCQPQCESVKVLSPEIFLVALGQGFHILEASISMHVKGECISDVSGSKSVAGKRTVYVGTWENRSVPKGSCQGAEKATKRYGVSVVGDLIMFQPVSHVRGFCELVRYADDFVCVVQYADDAQRIERALKNRFGEYGLEIHPTKSRKITFGRFERANAGKQDRRPNTFDFLGFTHYCDTSRRGNFKLGRKTSRKKFSAKCREMNDWLKAIRNLVKTKDWWKLLAAKLRGHIQYYGVSENYASVAKFYKLTLRMVRKWLNRRSQKRKMSWAGFTEYLEHYPLPQLRIVHKFYDCRV